MRHEIMSEIDQRFRSQTWALVMALLAVVAILVTAMM